MKAKMHYAIALVGLIMVIGMGGCKENDWMDWRAQNELWLEQNALKDSVVTTESGLQYKIIYQGIPTDTRPDKSKTIVITYQGYLINGAQFDGGTAQMSMATMISGFSEGMRKINNKGIIEIYVPCYLGYDEEKFDTDEEYEAEGTGTEGTRSYIPPYSTLIFRVTLDAVY